VGALGTIVSNLSFSTSHPFEVLNVVESSKIFSSALGASTAGAAGPFKSIPPADTTKLR